MDIAVIVSSVIIAVLTAVIIWLLKLPLMWLATRIWNKLVRRLQKAVKVFPPGTVEPLSKKHFANPADLNRIQQFYEGGNLGWDIIAAIGDVERDQIGDLLEKLRAPKQGPRLICLSAPSLAGKSTLTWRAAATLFQKDRATVLWVKRPDDPNVWYHLSEFCHYYGGPIYVLVDDLFRHPEVTEALRFIDPCLPVTILATSQDNEPFPSRLPFSIITFVLAKPSKNEIERTLNKLGRNLADLSGEQRKRLNMANDYGIVMIELTEGKNLLQAIRERVSLLQTQDEVVFQAYEYICFVAQYGLSFPEELIQRLDDQGRFFRLPQRARAKGVINDDEARPGRLKGRNPAVERVAFSCYGRNPITILTEIVRRLNMDSEIERGFSIYLCGALLRDGYGRTQQERAQIFELIKDAYKYANKIRELYHLRYIYKSLGQQSVASSCTDAALRIPPQDTYDCNYLIAILRKNHCEKEALPILEKYIRSSHINEMFPGFLDILENHGTPKQIQEWILNIHTWLKSHPEDSQVRTRYMGLVEKTASGQIPQLMEETRAWLAKHPEDSQVRTRYMGLVEKTASGQIPQIMEETRVWLAEHTADSEVRARYLGLAEKHAAEQIPQIMEETHAWLAEHPEDSQVRARYLGLAEKHASEQIPQSMEETRAWLAKHPEDSHVRTRYLGLAEKSAADQIPQIMEQTHAWLAEHTEDSDVRTRYLGLAEKSAAEQIPQIMEETRSWLAEHPADSDVRTRYLGLVETTASGQIPQIMEETRAWLAEHPEDSNVRTRYLGLVEKHAAEQIPQIMEETRAWLAEHPQENVRIRAIGILIRNGLNETAIEMLTEAVHKIDTVIADSNIAILGQYLRLLGDKIDPETAMRLGHELSTANPSDKTELAHWLRDKGHIDAAERLYQEISRLTPEQTTGRMRRSNQYGYGKLLLSIGRPKEAEDQFRTVLNTHKGHWAARVGLANTLQKQGTQAKEAADPIQAEKFFKKAEQELESAAWWIKLNKMDMAPIYNKFGWLYIQMERYQEALDAFCKAGNVEGLEGNNFGRYWGIGKALTELHKFEHALSYLENALQEAGELKPPASEEISALIEICVVQQQRQILEQSN